MNNITLDRKGVGSDLRKAREHLRLSLAGVGDASGVAASHIWHLERGRKSVSLDCFLQVSVALGLSPSRLLMDNLKIDRWNLVELAAAELGIDEEEMKSDKPASDDFAIRSCAASYAGSCAVIIIKSIISDADSVSHWDIPIKEISDALGVVLLRLHLDSLAARWQCQSQLQKTPVTALKQLGMWTPALLEAHLRYVVGGDPARPRPWFPLESTPTGIEHVGSNVLSGLDPLALGGLLSEIREHTGPAEARAAIRYLKGKKKNKKAR